MQTRQWIHNIFGVDIRIQINLEIRIRILDHFPFTFCSWQSVCSLSALAVYATEMVNQVMLAVNSNIKLETIWINLSVDCHTFLIQLNLDLTFLLYYWCSLSNWLPVPIFSARCCCCGEKCVVEMWQGICPRITVHRVSLNILFAISIDSLIHLAERLELHLINNVKLDTLNAEYILCKLRSQPTNPVRMALKHYWVWHRFSR